MSHNKEIGFSAVIAIVGILVITGLGLSGWYVWNKNKQDDTVKVPSNKAMQIEEKQDKQADPSEGGKYLVIKEWGVRFPLPEELRGDILTYESGTDISGTIIFASRKLNNLTGDDTCNFVRQPDGRYAGGIQATLSRVNPSTYPKDALEIYKRELNFVKQLGDYAYYSHKSIKSPPITCLTNQHEEFNDIEQSISNQLNEAFDRLEPLEQ